jgi:cytochrome c oxidase subunit II
MIVSTPMSGRHPARVLAWLALAWLPVACGGADDAPLPPLAAEGRDIVRSSGCSACHGRDGTGGVGPSWVGLWGTMEELDDAEPILVDGAYLRRSITDPAADKVAGYTVTMPENDLDDGEIEAVIAYIEALGP